MQTRLIYYLSLALLFAVSKPDLHAQSGFAKAIPIDANVDIDDIIFYNNQLILRGNIYIDSISLWGLYLTGLDTMGNVLWKSVMYDTSLSTHIILNTPGRFLVTNNHYLVVPAKYYNTGQLAIYFTDLVGHEIYHRFYPYEGFNIFPFDLHEVEGDYYIIGSIANLGSDQGVFALKIRPNGDMVWIKYYGLANEHENSVDAIVNPDNTISIYATRFNDDFLYSEAKEGWKKPWLITIDTSGAIINEWLGDENDPRTLGGGYFYRMKSGDWIMQSIHYKNVPNEFGEEVRVSPTITRLDNKFNLIWKVYLSNYEKRSDMIQDMTFDTLSSQIIITGGKQVLIGNKFEFMNWTIKMDTLGQILWDNTDSIYYSRQNTHNTAGLDISPSGSIYVGGYVTVNELEPRSQAFVIKYTADGCSDTICTTTFIEEQINNRDKNVFLFPNPASDEINILIKELHGDGELLLYDVQGVSLLRKVVGEGNNKIPFDLPSGLYFYSIRDRIGTIQTGKFVVR